MMSLLKNGKIPRPRDLEYARTRCQNLEREIARIGLHLGDSTRWQNYDSLGAYEAWRQAALRARQTFEEELRQYRQWIHEEEQSGVELLREVDAWLQELQGEIDFEPYESELARRVREFVEGSE